MMRRQATLLLLFLSLGWAARAQFALLPGPTFDFGNVETWRNDPAVFHLVNTGTKPLAILRLTGSKDIVAEYPKNYVAPGDTAHIVLRYYTPHDGPFSQTVDVVLNTAPQPVKLTLKGRIKSLAADALTACPSDQLQGTPANFYQQFLAVDAQTGATIPGTQFLVGTRGQMLDQFKTAGNGRSTTKTYRSGLYVLNISAEGYTPVDTGIVILAGQRTFTFRLNKTHREEPVVAVVPTPAPEPVQPKPVTQPAVTPVPPQPATPAVATLDSTETNPVLPLDKFKPNNIVFVLDVSASMRILGRIDMLRDAMLRLTQVLRKADRVSIITFTTTPVTRIQGVSGDRKDTLNGIIRSLNAGGATNGLKGLRFAYGLAESHFIAGGNNMVIIGTDGVFAQTDENGNNITVLVEEYLGKNIKLGVMAFGRDENALQSMEKMARKGQGGYMRMDNPENAPKLLLEQIQKQSAREN